MIDRRAVFFLVSAALTAALIPLLPDDPKHVWLHRTPFVMIIGLVVLAGLSWLDHWSRNRDLGR
jgi:hypothetical protein